MADRSLLIIMMFGLLQGCGTTKPAAVSDCDNAFVLSDYGQFRLMEYEPARSNVNTLLHHEAEQITQASYLCGAGQVLSTYGFRGPTASQSGFEIVHLNGRAVQRKFKDGPVNFIRHKDGILVETNLLRAEPLNDALGTSPFLLAEKYSDPPMDDGKEVFSYTHYIPFANIENLTFSPVHSYRFRVRVYEDGVAIERDTLVASTGSIVAAPGLYRIDLNTGRRALIHDIPGTQYDIRFPGKGDGYYFLMPANPEKYRGHNRTAPPEQNPIKARRNAFYSTLAPNTLYRIEWNAAKNNWVQQAMRAFTGGVHHYLRHDNAIYIFTRDNHVVRFDTDTNHFQEYPFEFSGKFESINVIKDGFVFTVPVINGKPGDYDKAHEVALYVASSDFSRLTQPRIIPRSGGVGTRISTQYNFAADQPKGLYQ